jgi:hypothetical protein
MFLLPAFTMPNFRYSVHQETSNFGYLRLWEFSVKVDNCIAALDEVQ